jgi:aryl-alcohol dehydrogenase-like predicted oxidoreductase
VPHEASAQRRLGRTEIHVSPLALGCWPIAGVTSLNVTDADSTATIAACFDLGINFLDTAYCYGRDGESERLIARALGRRRREMVIATKGGISLGADLKPVKDARPATLRRQCEESLQRLETDHVDLLYLHAPDPATPIAESAGELRRLMEEGKTRSVGASNLSLAQLQAFAAVCPVTAFQPHYNLLQREIESEIVPWCVANGVSICSYWPLLKGLLAGKLSRDHQFDPKDGRAKYPMFQGTEWTKNQDLLDELRVVAARSQRSVAELVLAWTIAQPGISSALVGAKRPDQIRENAAAMSRPLTDDERTAIEPALNHRGPAVSRSAV